MFIFEDSYLQPTQVHFLFLLIYKFTFINLRTEFCKGNRRPLLTGFFFISFSYGSCETCFLLKIELKCIRHSSLRAHVERPRTTRLGQALCVITSCYLIFYLNFVSHRCLGCHQISITNLHDQAVEIFLIYSTPPISSISDLIDLSEAMSVAEENWQTTRPTIRERTKFIFNNDLFSDVKFVLQKTDGESESKQVIPAHKFVLSISSPVFEAMFYGKLADTRDSIELPDCEYESLLELFRYMYSDEVNLSGSNVMGVLHLAKKYMVPSLAEKCTEYLQKNLAPSNVFSILPSARKYEEKNLVDRCWKVIDKQTGEAVKSDGFATIERSLLEAVVIRDTLRIEEIELFKAVDLWATKECERQGLAVEGAVKRRILGEKIVKEIRFPTMKQEDFASVVLASDILKKEEIVSIIRHLSSVSSSSVGFPETKRSGFNGDIQRCCRFNSTLYGTWNYDETRDAIDFSVDRDIAIHGVCFFGSMTGTYTVDLKLSHQQTDSVLVSLASRKLSGSTLLQSTKFSYYGFEVSFDKKVILKKKTRYCISALISGPSSIHGTNGVRCVQCSGVTFTFMDSSPPNNATGVTQGQFPELLFSL